MPALEVSRHLKHKPLVEAIYEFRWSLGDDVEKPQVDPNYKLLIGRLYDKISGDYPIHTELPAAQLPDSMSAYVVQHQFRSAVDSWPLVQLGSGVVTLNDTSKYSWTDFSRRIYDLTAAMYSTYPDASERLKPTQVLLRYLDAFALPAGTNGMLKYLEDNLKVHISLPSTLFDGPSTEKNPSNLEARLSFPTSKPPGVISIGLQKALRKSDKAAVVMMDMQVVSKPGTVPSNCDTIRNWVSDAHALAEDWFFKLIDGTLLKEFE